jgi:hypothetical protein
MEQRNIVLRGIATALNTFGSTLVTVYDLTASALGKVLPDEKEKLRGKIREHEEKIERLYSEVGKEVSKEGDMARLSAAGEAALSLIAENRIEIERIKQGIHAIEEAERKEKERVLQEKESAERLKGAEPEETVKAAGESAPEEKIEKKAETEEIRAEPSLEDTIVTFKASPGLVIEAEKEEPLTEVAEPPKETLPLDTRDPGVPITDDASSDFEKGTEKEALTESAEAPQGKPAKYTRELLGNKLKGDLLTLCTEKGIVADKSMTKAEIIELLLKVT